MQRPDTAPLGIALAATSAIYMLIVDVPLVAVAQRIYTSLDQFTLTAIPAFALLIWLQRNGGVERVQADADESSRARET